MTRSVHHQLCLYANLHLVLCSYLFCPTAAAAADAAAAAAKWSWPTMGCVGCMAGCGGHPASVLRASPPGPGPVIGFMVLNIIPSLLLSPNLRILFLSS